MKKIVIILAIVFTCVSCDSYMAKKAIRDEAKDFGLEIRKIELEQVSPGHYEGLVYLKKGLVFGLLNSIPVDAEKVDGEWVVSIDY